MKFLRKLPFLRGNAENSKPDQQLYQLKAGFADHLKDQTRRNEAVAHMEEVRRAVQADEDISDEGIATLVRELYDPETCSMAHSRLFALGERALPFLLRELRSPRLRKFGLNPPEGRNGVGAPLQCICAVVQRFAAEEAIPVLAELAQTEDRSRLAAIGQVLAAIGTESCVKPLLPILNYPEGYVAEGVWYRVMEGIRSGKGDGEYRRAMWDISVEAVVNPYKGRIPRDPNLHILFQIDRQKARSIVVSDKFLRPNYKHVWWIVKFLNEIGEKIPTERVYPLLKAFEKEGESRFRTILLAYARNPDDNIHDLLKRRAKIKDVEARISVWEARQILAGVDKDPLEFIELLECYLEYDDLTEPQKLVAAIWELHGEICNGGIHQYFVNSSGDNNREALRGLKAIGAKRCAKIIQKAYRQFGRKGPSTDFGERNDQVSNLNDKQDLALGKLNDEYYRADSEIEWMIPRYVVKHADHFRLTDELKALMEEVKS